MESYSLLFLAFFMVFISELGDKTQLLVLSFSSYSKTSQILFGVALGSFFSHGIAILFGSALGLLENPFLHTVLEIATYASFLLFGLISFIPSRDSCKSNTKKDSFLKKLSCCKLHYSIIIALSIAIGELGDKTFLASLGLGIQYPSQKVFLIVGAILGMVISDSIAILLGKFLRNKISESAMERLSGALFLLFGFIGLVTR